MSTGIDHALIEQPGVHLEQRGEAQTRLEEPLADHPNLVLDLPFSQPEPGVQATGSTR